MFKLSVFTRAALPLALALSFASAQAADPCAPLASSAPHPALTGEARADALPETIVAEGIRYVTGGIGIDEATAMRGVRKDYSLGLTFAVRECGANQFAADVDVRIERADGTAVLQLRTQGPYLFADLPPGKYRLTATGEVGTPQQRTLTLVAGRRTDLVILWQIPH